MEKERNRNRKREREGMLGNIVKDNNIQTFSDKSRCQQVV